MSWFSDFAKSALNEAQKRIDKVLDIDDDHSLKQDQQNFINPIKSSYNNDKISHDVQPKTSLKSDSLATSKPIGISSSTKKRGKPMKLGSSLSKKTFASKLHNQNGENKEPVKTDLQADFEDISIQKDQNFYTEDVTLKSTLNPHCPDTVKTSNMAKSQNLSVISDVDKSNNELNDTALNCLENIQDKIVADGKPANGSPVHPQLNESQLAAVSGTSPCGSTTASSEIEILDHESTVSEASAVLKLNELDNRPHVIAPDVSSQMRISPDAPESEDASDIGRVSGYCSSPLSVESNESSSLFHVQSNSTSKFENLEDVADVESLPTFVSFQEDEDTVTEGADADSTTRSNDENTDDISSSGLKTNSFETMLSVNEEVVSMDQFSNLQMTEVYVSDCVSSTQTSVHADETSNLLSDIQQIQDDCSTPPVAFSSNNVEEVKVSSSLNDKMAENKNLEGYEQQLLTLSLDNAKLKEENDNLRSELKSVKAKQEEDFAKQQQNLFDTIESLSRKIQELELNKSELSDQLTGAQHELSTRLSNEEVQSLLADKEESIRGLLEEGEILSKKHLQLNNTIKKLRSKLSERESSAKDLNDSLEKLREETKSLKARLAAVEGQSTEERGNAKRLSEAYQVREAELTDMRQKLEDAEEKKRASQSTLDVAYKDLADLNKQLAALKADREIELKQNEARVKEKMQIEMEKLKDAHEMQLHSNMVQLAQIRNGIERSETQHEAEKIRLGDEIEELRKKLHDAEARYHEVANTITESSRPIWRQVENLQNTLSVRQKNWEAMEKNLASRLEEANAQMNTYQKREISMQALLVDSKNDITVLESQIAQLRNEKSLVDSELKQLRSTSEKNISTINKLQDELTESKKKVDELKVAFNQEKCNLENQHHLEVIRIDAERKKLITQVETLLKEKERSLWVSRSDSFLSTASALNTDAESFASSNDTVGNAELFERQTSTSTAPTPTVYDSIKPGTGIAAMIESLQSKLKMKSGEIRQLQGDVNTLGITRDSMNTEIVRLTNENEELSALVKEVDELKRKLKETEARYEAVLTMYGEKAEEAEELKLDLEDVKTMYRNQIDILMKSQ